jgi:hypothetical protein
MTQSIKRFLILYFFIIIFISKYIINLYVSLKKMVRKASSAFVFANLS